jgi:phosphatidylglycerophosphate synthase
VNLRSLRTELEARQVFKAWEIEENLDRYFFRPVAVVFTAVFLPLRITPDQVSVAGMLLGMASAIFLFGPSLPALGLAVALLWLSEILDAADGQLARMQKEPSRYGRIVDGVCSMLMYLVVYFSLGAGLLARTGDWTWPALALLAVMSHSLQSALYDFYRGEYIRIVKKREASDPDAPEALADAQRETGTAPIGLLRAVALALYRHYALRQVWTTPTYQPLLKAIEARFSGRPVSDRFAKAYGEQQRGMVRWWNYLGPNVHLLMLTAAILVRQPGLFLWGNVVLLNVYGLALVWVQHGTSTRLIRELSLEEPAPQSPPVAGRAMAEV